MHILYNSSLKPEIFALLSQISNICGIMSSYAMPIDKFFLLQECVIEIGSIYHSYP